MSTPSFTSSSRFALRCVSCSSSVAMNVITRAEEATQLIRPVPPFQPVLPFPPLFLHSPLNPVQHPVDELHRFLAAERPCQLDGLVDDDRRRRLRAVTEQ